LWKLRYTLPNIPRQKVPGGTFGLILITLGPTVVFLLAVYSQVVEEGMSSLGMALGAIVVGAILYFPIRARVKPGVPDVNPFEAAPEAE
jgi:hypothetical protein